MKGFRTLLVNGIIALLPVLDFVVNNGETIAALSGPEGAAIIAGISAINMVLRLVTNTPVGQKGE